MADSAGLVRSLVPAAPIEVIPLPSVGEKLTDLPPGSTVTVTCSQKLGLGATIECAALAAAAGHRVVPHLAARQIRDAAELDDIVGRLRECGIDDVYVVGGDAPEPGGTFASAGDLLDALERGGHRFATVGVACYPEGHPAITDDVLLAELRRKQLLADYMVSQMCFNGATLIDWLRNAREVGIGLPLRIGIAAPLKGRKLLDLSMKIGVGPSLRFLTKQRGFVGNMLIGGRYHADHLLQDLGRVPALHELAISGLHIFSFNEVAGAVAWQRQYQQAELENDPGVAG